MVPSCRDLPQAEAFMRVLQEAGVSCEYVEEPLCPADVSELPALFLLLALICQSLIQI